MKKLIPENINELIAYLEYHELDAVITQFMLETDTLSRFGFEQNPIITMTIECKDKTKQ